MQGPSGYTSMYGGMAPSFPVQDDAAQPAGWWALGLTRILIGILWWSRLLWKAPRHFGTADGTCTSQLYVNHMSKLFVPGKNTPVPGLAGLCDWLHREATNPLHPTFFFFGHDWSPKITFYANFVRDTVIPHFALLGWIIFIVETIVTVSLFFGIFTRLGGLLGTIWALILAIGLWSVPGEWYWSYLMLAALCLIFFATRAGRYVGLDAVLVRAQGPLGELFRLLG